jgi:hypothetical protein
MYVAGNCEATYFIDDRVRLWNINAHVRRYANFAVYYLVGIEGKFLGFK